jgi:hypothetical protein
MKNLCPLALLCSLVAMPLAVSQPAQTHESIESSGNVFLRVCSVVEKEKSTWSDADISDIHACSQYVRGFTSGVKSEQVYAEVVVGKKVPAPFCLPDDIPNGQIVRIVLKSIRNNPETSHQSTRFSSWVL